MLRLQAALGALVLTWASAGLAAPLDAYGHLPALENAVISPDGRQIALLRTNGELRQIAIETLADGKTPHVLGIGDAKIRALQWVGPDHLILTTSKTTTIQDTGAPRAEYFLIFDYSLKTRKLYPLLRDVPRSLPTVFGPPMARMLDGKPNLFVEGIQFNDSGQGMYSLFRIDLEKERAGLVEMGTLASRGWLVDANGYPIAQTTYDDRSGRWSLKVKAGPGWREGRSVEHTLETPALEGLGRDGHTILMREMMDGRAQVREVGLDGAWGPPLDIADDDSAIFDPAAHNLIGYHALIGEEQRYNFLEPQDQTAWSALLKAFPDQQVRLISWSDDRQKLVVAVNSPVEGPAFALVDAATHAVTRIGPQFDRLQKADIATVRPIRFKAQDGVPLSGYLTIPHGADPKNLPLVVFPHGGPAVRDEPGFNWWAQAMASRGYAVLQVNYRGSSGFGWNFLQAGFGQWGRKMQTDLSDGVRDLARQGIVDPKRVCIVGASYGGYAAMAGPTLDPGVYRCAAAYAGISDLRSFAPWVRNQSGIGPQRYLVRFVGAESARDPSLSEISPAAHVDRVSVPMLLIHGKDDTVVPLEQSRIMADALKAAGKPVEFITLDSTDHWLTRGDTRLAMLQAVVAFLEKNNPPN
ncbi:alpha/beta hydrolase family protein [Phenylobacterium sp.]|uniref:alpha/beta hydrolase family protein n=1 Tax=Phenylobacterium sp. TaxID=1871053 RepID=UPI00356358D6